ncbi:MAG: DUF3850 domain-containing protein [Gammaproteobacteria bacterium]|nr:DUF3850 domain-containing protein [Gammaproteobacteria bacterium]
MTTTIEKKIWPESFELILSGKKTYDLRLSDWDCTSGDTLILKEWDPKTKNYTGREVTRQVGYVGHVGGADQDPYFNPQEVQKHGYQLISLLPSKQ